MLIYHTTRLVFVSDKKKYPHLNKFHSEYRLIKRFIAQRIIINKVVKSFFSRIVVVMYNSYIQIAYHIIINFKYLSNLFTITIKYIIFVVDY